MNLKANLKPRFAASGGQCHPIFSRVSAKTKLQLSAGGSTQVELEGGFKQDEEASGRHTCRQTEYDGLHSHAISLRAITNQWYESRGKPRTRLRLSKK